MDAAQPGQEARSRPKADNVARAPLLVLLVDDGARHVALINDELTRQGHLVVGVVGSALLIHDGVLRLQPDIVIGDVVMAAPMWAEKPGRLEQSAPYNAPMRILIANDDGYLAPGLAALVQACQGLGEIAVFAPEQNASGTSNALTLNRPLNIFTARGEHVQGFQVVNGTPSDSVHVALTGVLGYRPDLVLSGINNGANMGDDTLYSGTVAAAMEGYLFGVPAIAFSQAEKGWGELDAGAATARAVVEQVLAQAPLGGAPWLLNVNIPNRADALQLPRVITRLGRRHASQPVIRQTNPRGETIYWIGPAGDARECGEGTDFHAVANGHVSITPLQVDLTDHAASATWAQRLAGRPA